MPALNRLAGTTWRGDETYDQVVHFLHVYVIEPHPAAPDPSPYRGTVWEDRYSTLPQPRTQEARVENALATVKLLEGEQRMLVDAVGPDGTSNPVWCTYGPAPNPGYLIGQDGTIVAMQPWIEWDTMQRAIDELLGD